MYVFYVMYIFIYLFAFSALSPCSSSWPGIKIICLTNSPECLN